MNRNKILITGNLGYNGAAVVKCLNENGHYTIGLDIHYFQHYFYDDDSILPKMLEKLTSLTFIIN